jgi:hypothetical protein
MKVSETVAHYIGLFGGFAILFLVIYSGWGLAEQSVWFADLWEPMANRVFIILVGTVSIVSALAYAYSYFWGHKKFIRTFKEVEILKLDKCQDNELVRIQGKLVLLGESLIAPYSGKQCAAFETRASTMEEVVTAKGSGSHVESKTIWETLKLVSDTSDFLIKCEELYAIVRVDECKLKIHEDIVHDESSYAKDRGGFLTENENNKRQETLTRMNHSYRNYIGVYAEDIKFEEGILEQDEQVAVRGIGKWINVAELEELSFLVEKGVDKVFEIRNSADYQLHISDSLDVLEKAIETET